VTRRIHRRLAFAYSELKARGSHCAANPAESQAGHSSIPAALTRISAVLVRSDLHAIHLVRAEPAPSAKGVSYKAYRQVAGRSRLVYSALSGTGESIPEREESIEEFQGNGGIVTQPDA
jgi:hypothetical protein